VTQSQIKRIYNPEINHRKQHVIETDELLLCKCAIEQPFFSIFSFSLLRHSQTKLNRNHETR